VATDTALVVASLGQTNEVLDINVHDGNWRFWMDGGLLGAPGRGIGGHGQWCCGGLCVCWEG